jgi:hypothetical protein
MWICNDRAAMDEDLFMPFDLYNLIATTRQRRWDGMGDFYAINKPI